MASVDVHVVDSGLMENTEGLPWIRMQATHTAFGDAVTVEGLIEVAALGEMSSAYGHTDLDTIFAEHVESRVAQMYREIPELSWCPYAEINTVRFDNACCVRPTKSFPQTMDMAMRSIEDNQVVEVRNRQREELTQFNSPVKMHRDDDGWSGLASVLERVRDFAAYSSAITEVGLVTVPIQRHYQLLQG